MVAAAKYGRLDLFKILEAMAQDFPPEDKRTRSYSNSKDDYFVLALHNNRQSLFEYLLSFDTKDRMDKRMEYIWSYHIIMTISQRTPDDWREMAAIMKALIKHIETHYKKLQHALRVFGRLFDQDVQFTLVLKCQDMELARQCYKYIEFDAHQLSKHCDDITRHSNHEQIPPLSPEDLGPKVDFIFEVLQLYKCRFTRVIDQWPACREVLTEIGVMMLDIYTIRTKNNHNFGLAIARQIFKNVRQDANQSEMVKFIQFFFSRDMKTDDIRRAIIEIYATGTLDMVKIALDIAGRTWVMDLSCYDIFPKSVETLEYLVEHGMHQMANSQAIIHFASMCDPDELRKLLSTFPTILPRGDDLSKLEDDIMDIFDNHNIDTCFAIQSVIQDELVKAQRNDTFDIVTMRVHQMTLPQVQSLPDDTLNRITITPPDIWKVDPSVISYLLSKASALDFESDLTESLMEAACTHGLTECVHLLDSSSKVFVELRSNSGTMATLLLAAYNYGHISICQYLVGCGASLKKNMWKEVNSDGMLDVLFEQQQTPLTQSEKEKAMYFLCSNPNSSLIRMVYTRWSKDIKLNRETLVEKAFKCKKLDRVDVLACITEMIVDCSRSESNNNMSPKICLEQYNAYGTFWKDCHHRPSRDTPVPMCGSRYL
ncbi:hypothetical protein SAMD00019534_030300 [Acytostelium subglobosum LB1]|uniref:hypothetical protein n=1 Tax=Acytostelium subglobosum LB1 TaxID=1410327 RepID=UPI000644DB88|nr:hypothetical protein SAMD00019534_030300 [Acytostelium subglobosum LB1]GAM19855.1 hypothetical protein SAMD00019534_030300 [Acytostelium subglobosum LB1]|eukprot:XP_012756617.1 hypothetical protein SAMD00019534_030300 [Acytostelium subglobosum LB1]